MAEAKQRRGGSLGFVVGFAIAIPVTIFALSNLESAQVEFLGWTAEVPLWAVIVLSFVAGALVGVLVLVTWRARRKHGRRKAAKAAAKREQRSLDENARPALEPSGTDAAGATAALGETPEQGSPTGGSDER